ncbi:lysylphosphatidylglycerol synthase transmembrane domain-containing protein [Streptomyces lusitanus]|uniref:Lysylphosphatidylglycerol synthase transmembrane domain-containing protein n=1 Tax=Streptomyces lusitanus TaxID=68232 RepID=A0ABU3JPZ1_9ACTN|nr:lysylphosphatidylglycerol synthase transmembrane domain-containing protein [Streptomyces lusitanus]
MSTHTGETAGSEAPTAEAPAGGGGVRRLLGRLGGPAVRTRLGTLAGVVILAVLFWRLGTGAFVDGVRRIDAPTLAAALGIGLVTTVFSAWRWALVARGIGIRLPFGAAVADYYRALFLNAALPGGVLGDVHRAVRHGQDAGDLGRGVRAVVLERTAGQLALFAAGGAVLLTMPSPVHDRIRQAALPAGLGLLGACAVVLALRMNRAPSGRKPRAVRGLLGEARQALFSRSTAPGVLVSSVVVLAGYVAMFVLAADVAGAAASVAQLLPLALLALLAMSLPLNVGGWGPREGVAAWAFGAAGLGAGRGLTVAVVYGVLSLAASLPGAVVLVARWYAAARDRRTGGPAHSTVATRAVPEPAVPEPRPLARETETETPQPDRQGPLVRIPAQLSEVRSEKYAPKESARLARSSLPFSAVPSEGRPMTPESV